MCFELTPIFWSAAAPHLAWWVCGHSKGRFATSTQHIVMRCVASCAMRPDAAAHVQCAWQTVCSLSAQQEQVKSSVLNSNQRIMSPTDLSIEFHKISQFGQNLAQAAASSVLAGSVHAMLQCTHASHRHRAAGWQCCRACTLSTFPLPHQRRFRLPARVPHLSKIPGLEPARCQNPGTEALDSAEEWERTAARALA